MWLDFEGGRGERGVRGNCDEISVETWSGLSAGASAIATVSSLSWVETSSVDCAAPHEGQNRESGAT